MISNFLLLLLLFLFVVVVIVIVIFIVKVCTFRTVLLLYKIILAA
jgi:hypothetical protein